MLGNACRNNEALDWLYEGFSFDEWEPLDASHSQIQGPGQSYSKRSTHLAELRSKNEWATQNADDFIRAPTAEAFACAKNFINNLPDGCLDFHMAFSQDGEINFFFGEEEELFQIFIDQAGMISFYAKTEREELGGSDVSCADFKYFQLLKFVERKK